MFVLPLVTAHDKCDNYPDAVELIVALKPHFAKHMRPYFEEEIGLLKQILDEGNARGELDVQDTAQAARSMKIMTMGLFPPYPCIEGRDEIEHECDLMVKLVIRGLTQHKRPAIYDERVARRHIG